VGKADRFALVGNTIAGTFRVDDIVAEGGFGVVYRAYHLHFRAPVALKCLKIPDELTAEERHEFLEQFRSEAEIMFRLSASLPNIVRPLHVDAVQAPTGEFVPLMALEWLEGKSFEKIIEERCFAGLAPLTLTDTLDLLGPAADALDSAHHFEDGTMVVVHRDIKPDNLFLTNVGGKPHVKILDFGISKMRRQAGEGAGRASQTSGQAPFSPAYGAPEQWVPKRFGQTGPWTDVWGLALTLVEIIKGDAVIVGDHQAMMGTALDPLIRPTPRKEGVEVTDEIEGVFEKALALDPRYRFQTVKTFWAALTRAIELGGDPTGGKDTSSGSKIKLPPMVAPTPWTPPPGLREPGTPAIRGLPPMMAPAPLEASLPEERDSVPSYPRDPESGLAPLLSAAPAVDEDLHIPALDEENTPGPGVLELDVEPHFERATSSGAAPRPELRLELDEEALADAVASPRAMTLMEDDRYRSEAPQGHESKPPDSIDLPADFLPVELTPIHRFDDAPATVPQTPFGHARQAASPRTLPEVPDLTPSRAPRGGSLRSPAPPPPPRRSLPVPAERRGVSPTSDVALAAQPNRPKRPNDEERGPPPPPRREKAR
jgi:serine/threonine protein kinase